MRFKLLRLIVYLFIYLFVKKPKNTKMQRMSGPERTTIRTWTISLTRCTRPTWSAPRSARRRSPRRSSAWATTPTSCPKTNASTVRSLHSTTANFSLFQALKSSTLPMTIVFTEQQHICSTFFTHCHYHRGNTLLSISYTLY